MKLLLILLSAMMTFTVESKSKVKADGTWPYSMSASYACTYQKGDVRANDTATLVVSGLDGIAIEKVDLYLKSNKDKGAGIITMTADGQEFYRAEGTYKDWFGAYNNTDYQAKGWSGDRTVNELTVQVIGKTNSLHIEKYEITWRQTSTAYDVTLMNGDELVETLHGDQVVLPSMPDTANWHFIGWYIMPFYELDANLWDMIEAGVYQPSADVTLWAVYQYEMPVEKCIVTDLYDGNFVYANLLDGLAMSGGIEDGEAGSSPVNLKDLTQHYEVAFDRDGKAYIRLIYVYGEEYIGYEGDQLTNTESAWDVYHEGDKTAFYTMYNDKIYVLLPNKWNETKNQYVTALVKVQNLEAAQTVLLQPEGAFDVHLTCYPQIGLDVEEVESGKWKVEGDWIIPFGNYELIIRDGRKELRVKE